MTAAIACLLLVTVQDIPVLKGPVEDRAGALSPEVRAELVTLVTALQESDSTQVVVLTVKTTSGTPIEEFSLNTAQSNGIGQKGKDNGVLILVAVADRKMRIEVGYGLEGVLTDALCSHIIRKEMIPRFRENDYPGGILAGTRAVIGAVKGTYKPEVIDIDPSVIFKGFGSFIAFFIGCLLMAFFPKFPIGIPLQIFAVVTAFGAAGGIGIPEFLFLPWFMIVFGAIWDLGCIFGKRGGGNGSRWSSGSSYSSSSGSSGGGWSGGGGSFGGGGAGGSW